MGGTHNYQTPPRARVGLLCLLLVPALQPHCRPRVRAQAPMDLMLLGHTNFRRALAAPSLYCLSMQGFTCR